eukprot:Skav235769  [mRNA]  locus=scaffold1666:1882:2628:+ [translate_table: standard]
MALPGSMETEGREIRLLNNEIGPQVSNSRAAGAVGVGGLQLAAVIPVIGTAVPAQCPFIMSLVVPEKLEEGKITSTFSWSSVSMTVEKKETGLRLH